MDFTRSCAEGAGLEKVPEEEIRRRIQGLQSILDSRDMTGAFFLQNVDIFYLTGTLQRSVLYVPREGAPLLMVIKSYQRAREESSLEDIIPIQGRREIWNILADHGHRRFEHLGLELDVLPAAQYLWFSGNLPDTRFSDVSPEIRKLRMIKSPYEVEQIRRATKILDKGYREIRGLLREGMTELEIDGHLALIARREGHMGILRMRGWNQEMTYAHVVSGESGAVVSFGDTPVGGMGTTPAMAQGAGFRKIRKNEPISVDFGVGVNGYLSDQTRTLVLGELPDDLRRAHDCSRKILHLLAQEAKPGVPCRELYHLAEDLAGREGFGDVFMGYGEGKVKFIGHGFGLEIDEYPIITPSFPDVLQEGMVFALEPKFIFPGRGVVGIEDDYLVTSSGLERLTLTDQDLITIP
ncbi:MAG: aminopeptidase P family protein [Deltaproteobacteria bacterium]|nr:aminopeptidase P family protein [Deltaproteobacteria bacterium]